MSVDPDALRDDQWERLRDLIPGGRAGQRGPRCDNRRYYRWIERGALDGMLAALAAEPDLEWLMLDSTIVRAHQHAPGARRAKGGRMPKVWAAPKAA